MRLTDIITPDILERALHRPTNPDPQKDRAQTIAFAKEITERWEHVAPLAKVLENCLKECGSSFNLEHSLQLEIQRTTLAVLDAAIEMATQEAA